MRCVQLVGVHSYVQHPCEAHPACRSTQFHTASKRRVQLVGVHSFIQHPCYSFGLWEYTVKYSIHVTRTACGSTQFHTASKRRVQLVGVHSYIQHPCYSFGLWEYSVKYINSFPKYLFLICLV